MVSTKQLLNKKLIFAAVISKINLSVNDL